MKTLITIIACFFLTSCTFYSEKRSESLSQAVYATADSIDAARIDLADKYSEEAKKLAFPPKKKIEIYPIITKKVETVPQITVEKLKNSSKPTSIQNTTIEKSNLSTVESENREILRLVIPENLKHAELLIENSSEWNELLKQKEFVKQLETDNKNLTVLKSNVEKELQKQFEMSNKMVQDLNTMQKKLVEKDFAIWQRNIVILGLVLTITVLLYLRIKGII